MINWTSQNLTLRTNTSNFFNQTLLQRDCFGKEYFNAECLHKYFCPQLNSYFVNIGLILFCLTVLMYWFNWFFFHHAYKWIDWTEGYHVKFFGDMRNLHTRAYWDVTIKEQLLKAWMVYGAFVVYLNI